MIASIPPCVCLSANVGLNAWRHTLAQSTIILIFYLLLIRCRTPKSTIALIAAAPFTGFITMIPFALNHKKRKQKRKAILESATEWFNAEHQTLFMKFEKTPTKKRLLIMRREDARRLEIIE